ncbi:MAG: DUF4364 family protein [Clostridiales bacterium]|nr:DUF4364 family protein [Clostridiales bacterium]
MSIGFIKSPLEIMELILYILARIDGPVGMGELTDLALCDEGVDYFQFADALGKLKETGHVTADEDGLISITPKGRSNGETTEEELPYSVRVKCDRNVAALNRRLQRARQVRTQVSPRTDGSGYTARMVLDDERGNVMTLEMMAPDRTQAELLCRSYSAQPERLYNRLLSQLLEQGEG